MTENSAPPPPAAAPAAPGKKKNRRRRRRSGRGGAGGQPGAPGGVHAGGEPGQGQQAQAQGQSQGQNQRPKSTRLTEMVAQDVDSDVRRRGQMYFRDGRVFELEATHELMSAEVRGKGGNYKVMIALTPDNERQRTSATAVCGCPYFTGGSGYCKHIWAVLCYADGQQGSAFKAPAGHRVALNTLSITRPRLRPPAVVTAKPEGEGRIRGFSAGKPVVAPGPEAKAQKRPHGSKEKKLASWREAFKVIGHAQREFADAQKKPDASALADVHYVLDVEATARTGQLTVQIFRLAPVEDDPHGSRQLVAAPVDPRAPESLPAGADRTILTKFFGVVSSQVARLGQWDVEVVPLRLRGNSFTIADAVRPELLQLMASTGRFGWLTGVDKLEENGPFELSRFRPATWDGQELWTFTSAVTPTSNGQGWVLRGEFRRGDEVVPLADTVADFADGSVLFKDRVGRFEALDPHAYAWIRALREVGGVEVAKPDQAAFMRTYASMQNAPALDLPPGCGWKVVAGEPTPHLVFLSMPSVEALAVLTANYKFTYETPPGASEGPAGAPAQAAVPAGRKKRGRRGAAVREDSDAPAADAGGEGEVAVAAEAAPADAGVQEARGPRVVVRRNRAREEELIKELCEHKGVHPSAGRGVAGADVFVDATMLSELVSALTSRRWVVEAEGQKLRVGRSFQVDVTSGSGMDWLDLRALFDFGDGVAVQLPRILEAVAAGGDRVVLGDGSVGILPAAWLQRLEPILRMGESGHGEGSLRYSGNQAAFLDALVSDASEAHLDKPFAEFRAKLASFSGVNQAEPAKTFVGELRPYQQQGLGWLEYLDEFGFGGCLADDMGLGKTVQLLSHLDKRRSATRKSRTKEVPANLIVAPTSLIHNWADEAERFTPKLKVYTHVGPSRLRDAEELSAYDLVITSYGTMRSDIQMLNSVPFDYVVLDEAQAIKNEGTQVAQAARTLKAHRRLAMSGTPVENRLSELGSLFKFLNPGMIETSQGFAELFSGSGKLSRGQLETLARLLKPFILRRTKEQVLPDLPGKTESTVYCVLEDDRRKEYDELAQFYRDSLKQKIKTEGLGKSRMHVLEALLRLRQLACHPGLIDQARSGEPSAKLDLLEEQLDEVMASGRKALVFSQFTSMLAIVRRRLDEKGIVYEYLDGSTTDRKERVEHFQNDKDVRIFLISLKAGGVGLNLTAADYCFILDPWWNPATEAQAIDRAHRIGQKNHVFAYRLIARGTVEEKILAMQADKRKLVEGIIADDGDVLTGMTAKDLDFLLA